MKLSRRLIPAFAMLLVSAVLMSTASFAWFSINSDVTATGMSITATADSSLVIKGSKDGAFTSIGTNEHKDVVLNPTSSADGVKFAALKAGVRVQSTVAAGATWSDNINNDVIDGSGNAYVLESKYDLMNIGGDVEVFVKNITITAAKKEGAPAESAAAGKMLEAIRVAVFVTEGDTDAAATGAKLAPGTLIFNPKGGTLVDGGKAVGYNTQSKEYVLATPTYNEASTSKTDKNTLGVLKADDSHTLHILVWIEGQDETCTSANVDMSNYSVTVDLGAVAYTAPAQGQ